MSYLKMTGYDQATIAASTTLLIEYFAPTDNDDYKALTIDKTDVEMVRQSLHNNRCDLYLKNGMEIEIELTANTEIGGVIPGDNDELFDLLNAAIHGAKYTP